MLFVMSRFLFVTMTYVMQMSRLVMLSCSTDKSKFVAIMG